MVCEGADEGFCAIIGDVDWNEVRGAGMAAARIPDARAAAVAEASPPWMTRTTWPSSMTSPGATGIGAPETAMRPATRVPFWLPASSTLGTVPR